MGTAALTGATPLPRHQPQKDIHVAWKWTFGRSRTSQQQIFTKSPIFGGYAGESPLVKVQCVDAVVEPEVGLPQQLVPPWKCHWWLGQKKEKICEPLLIWPEGGDQSHGEMGSLSDSSHCPSDQRKGWKRVQVQVGPMMTKRILEDRLGIRDKGTV